METGNTERVEGKKEEKKTQEKKERGDESTKKDKLKRQKGKVRGKKSVEKRRMRERGKKGVNLTDRGTKDFCSLFSRACGL